MAPVSINTLLLVSFLSTFFITGYSIPTPSPQDGGSGGGSGDGSGGQYVDQALNKTANLDVVLTTETEAHIIDWIPIESQGDIATPPPLREAFQPDPDSNISIPIAELQLPGAQLGPPGTVPVPRVTTNYLQAAAQVKMSPHTRINPISKRDYSDMHWYVNSNQAVNNLGGQAKFSLFDAYVEHSSDFSILQLAVTRYSAPLPASQVAAAAAAAASGSNINIVTYATSSIQTVEAGWINYPDQGALPHLFCFYTTNGYSANGDYIGGWNQDVRGWVQYDKTYFPGTAFKTNSVIGGAQYELLMEYQLFNNNWWLWVNDRWMGYYPASLFSAGRTNPSATLAGGSDMIFFYGEVYQNETHLTTTDMGSGTYANAGLGQAGYIRNMQYFDSSLQGHDFAVPFYADDPFRYSGKYHLATTSGGAEVTAPLATAVSGVKRSPSNEGRSATTVSPNSGGGTGSWGSYAFIGGPGAGGVVGG